MLLRRTDNECMTVASLLKNLGDIPPERVHLDPPPGTATEKDVLDMERRAGRLSELVDATLVEKTRGVEESFLAMRLGYLLYRFLDEHDLGILTGEQGPFRLWPGLVRIPDISFVS